MSIGTTLVLNKIDKATEANREAKQLCNDALSVAKGRIQKLENDISKKDECIVDLNEQVAKLQAALLEDILQDLGEIREDLGEASSCSAEVLSGLGTDDNDDRWIPCSERMPERFCDVLIQIKDCDKPGSDFVPRTGYVGVSGRWIIYLEPGKSTVLSGNYAAAAWQPLPEKYEKPVVKPEPVEEEVAFEIGDFVLCVAKTSIKLNAIYTGEDDECYWVLDKQCMTPQHLDKNCWKLTKYPGHMSVVDWLTSSPVS